MLKSIDILLGFTVTMLVASMAVTVLTQIWTTVLNTRASHLRKGLAGLLQQLDPNLSAHIAKLVSKGVLSHPLIREAHNRMGSLVSRDEFTRVLLELASGNGVSKLPEAARASLQKVVAANGIADPAGTLQRISETALVLEHEHPALAASARHDLAIVKVAASGFVAKINGWFDQAIDRTRSRFTLSTQRITAINALLVALLCQLDSVSLMKRLASDETLRAALVEQAVAHGRLSATDLAAIERLALRSTDSLSLAARIPGIALSALLLSLGAPFWFERLKDLLRLRPMLPDRQKAP